MLCSEGAAGLQFIYFNEYLLRACDVQQHTSAGWRLSYGEGRQNLPSGTRILVSFYSRTKAISASAKHCEGNVAMQQREAQEGAEEDSLEMPSVLSPEYREEPSHARPWGECIQVEGTVSAKVLRLEQA